MSNPSGPGGAKPRNEAAEQLKSEIEDRIAGRAAPPERPNFREFIERKMAEDAERAAHRAPDSATPEDQEHAETPRPPGAGDTSEKE
jgi:hypothetical protein